MRFSSVSFVCLTLLAALAVPSLAHAQLWARLTNPTITVEIQHPPGLNISVERIAFGPARGECSNEIVQRLMDNFVSSGIEVVDRQSTDRLLDEHDFASTGYVDRATAAELGKLLGPSAMIMVEVQRCVTEQSRGGGAALLVADQSLRVGERPRR